MKAKRKMGGKRESGKAFAAASCFSDSRINGTKDSSSSTPPFLRQDRAAFFRSPGFANHRPEPENPCPGFKSRRPGFQAHRPAFGNGCPGLGDAGPDFLTLAPDWPLAAPIFPALPRIFTPCPVFETSRPDFLDGKINSKTSNPQQFAPNPPFRSRSSIRWWASLRFFLPRLPWRRWPG